MREYAIADNWSPTSWAATAFILGTLAVFAAVAGESSFAIIGAVGTVAAAAAALVEYVDQRKNTTA